MSVISERSSLATSSSLSGKDFNRLSMTGNNIVLSGKPSKDLKSMKKSYSQPELPSVQEMVNIRTKKNSQWGIDSYTVPKIGANLFISRKITMAPKCNDGMIDKITKSHSFVPPPGNYDISKKWSTTVLGSMKGGKRKTFISQLFRDQEIHPMPGPGQHSPSSKYTKKRSALGIVNKSGRDAFTTDAEFLGSISPGADYIDIMKKDLPRPFKYNLKKPKGWKVEKVDGPDPQSYPNKEKALNEITVKSSPKWIQSKGTRKFFTDDAMKKSQKSPGAGNYNTIDYSKIHRRLSTKRH